MKYVFGVGTSRNLEKDYSYYVRRLTINPGLGWLLQIRGWQIVAWRAWTRDP